MRGGERKDGGGERVLGVIFLLSLLLVSLLDFGRGGEVPWSMSMSMFTIFTSTFISTSVPVFVPALVLVLVVPVVPVPVPMIESEVMILGFDMGDGDVTLDGAGSRCE